MPKRKQEQMSEQLPRSEDALTPMFTVASEDVSALLRRRRQPDNATDQRALVRSVFAFVESMLFAMKQQILIALVEAPHGFTIAEFALLRDESYEVAENGEARVKTAKITLKSNLKFTFASWAKALGTKSKLDLSDEGWQNFQAALKVRDRLMHPKRASDLDVTEEEIKSATAAYFWFYTAYSLALIQVVKTTMQHRKKTGKRDGFPPVKQEDKHISPSS